MRRYHKRTAAGAVKGHEGAKLHTAVPAQINFSEGNMSELKEKYEEITNRLENAADLKLSREIRESQAYNEGYKQACEDFFKELRRMNSELN